MAHYIAFDIFLLQRQSSLFGRSEAKLSECDPYHCLTILNLSQWYLGVISRFHDRDIYIYFEYAFFLRANCKLFLGCVIFGAKNKIS